MGFSRDTRDEEIALLNKARKHDHRTIDELTEQLCACESLLRAARVLVVGWPAEHDARCKAFLLATGRFATPHADSRAVPTYQGPEPGASAQSSDAGTTEPTGT